MIEVNINDERTGVTITGTIPEEYDELTMIQYLEMLEITHDIESDLIKEQIEAKYIQYLLNIDEDVLNQIPFTYFCEWTNAIQFLFKEPTLDKEIKYVELNGDKYYINKDINIDTGTFVSIKYIQQRYTKQYEYIPHILPYFFIKEGETGVTQTQAKARIQLFKDCPVSVVAALFFSSANGKLE